MRDRHAEFAGSKLRIEFKGKSGIQHEIDIRDPKFAKIIKRCQELPGQELFQYVDDEARYMMSGPPTSTHICGRSAARILPPRISARGPVRRRRPALQEFEDFDTQAAAKRNITTAIERVAQRLGNTKAVCRKCYIHPAVIDAYMDRSLIATLKERTETELRGAISRLPAEEAAVLALLQRRGRRCTAVQGPCGGEKCAHARQRAGRRTKPSAAAG